MSIEKGFNPEKIVFDIEAELLRQTSFSEAKWVEHKAIKFRELIDSNPDLLSQYYHDPIATVKFIKDRLFGVRDNKFKDKL
jgi:hypothetical protein